MNRWRERFATINLFYLNPGRLSRLHFNTGMQTQRQYQFVLFEICSFESIQEQWQDQNLYNYP